MQVDAGSALGVQRRDHGLIERHDRSLAHDVGLHLIELGEARGRVEHRLRLHKPRLHFRVPPEARIATQVDGRALAEHAADVVEGIGVVHPPVVQADAGGSLLADQRPVRRLVEHLDVGLDADPGEVVLDRLQQRRPRLDVARVEGRGEAVGVTGLCQDLLGLGRVVAVEVAGRAVDVAGQAGGVDLVERLPRTREQLDDLGAIDRPSDRLPHEQVVERLDRHVHEQAVERDGRLGHHLTLPRRVGDQARVVGRRDVVAEQVGVAALHLEYAGRRRDRELEMDGVEVARRAGVVGVALEQEVLAGRPVVEHVRPGAQRVTADLLAPLGDPFLGDRCAEGHLHDVEERGDRLLEVDLEGVLAGRLVPGDGLGLAVEERLQADDAGVVALRRRRGQAHHALETVDEVLRRDLAVHRRRELDAGLDVEDVGLAAIRDAAVGHGRHLGRHVGDDPGAGGARAAAVVEQVAEDGVLDGPAGALEVDRGIEGLRLGLEGDDERASALRRGRSGARAPPPPFVELPQAPSSAAQARSATSKAAGCHERGAAPRRRDPAHEGSFRAPAGP